jgi:C-8 sterol isomerase
MAYLFDPEKLHDIARQAVGLPHKEMVQTIIDRLAEAYPGHIEKKQRWIFSLTAGATGVMTILHASLSEYILIFGTPIGTEGFSGRYHFKIYDWVLAGDLWTYMLDDPGTRITHHPGDVAILERRKVKGFRLPDAGWVLEYARGAIPTALPLALSDVVFSAMDWRTLFETLWIYGKLTTRELFKGKI